jgi:hypothetical protein
VRAQRCPSRDGGIVSRRQPKRTRACGFSTWHAEAASQLQFGRNCSA